MKFHSPRILLNSDDKIVIKANKISGKDRRTCESNLLYPEDHITKANCYFVADHIKSFDMIINIFRRQWD